MAKGNPRGEGWRTFPGRPPEYSLGPVATYLVSRISTGMIYQELTDGILVRVRPVFSLADSSPGTGRFVFTYHVELPARLQSLIG